MDGVVACVQCRVSRETRRFLLESGGFSDAQGYLSEVFIVVDGGDM